MSSQFTPSLSYHMWWVLARTIWSKAQQSGQGTWGMVSLGESPQGGKAPPQKKKPRWLTIRHSWQAWGTKRSDLTWGQATQLPKWELNVVGLFDLMKGVEGGKGLDLRSLSWTGPKGCPSAMQEGYKLQKKSTLNLSSRLLMS